MRSPGSRWATPQKPEVEPTERGESSVRISPPRRRSAGTSAAATRAGRGSVDGTGWAVGRGELGWAGTVVTSGSCSQEGQRKGPSRRRPVVPALVGRKAEELWPLQIRPVGIENRARRNDTGPSPTERAKLGADPGLVGKRMCRSNGRRHGEAEKSPRVVAQDLLSHAVVDGKPFDEPYGRPDDSRQRRRVGAEQD